MAMLLILISSADFSSADYCLATRNRNQDQY